MAVYVFVDAKINKAYVGHVAVSMVVVAGILATST